MILDGSCSRYVTVVGEIQVLCCVIETCASGRDRCSRCTTTQSAAADFHNRSEVVRPHCGVIKFVPDSHSQCVYMCGHFGNIATR